MSCTATLEISDASGWVVRTQPPNNTAWSYFLDKVSDHGAIGEALTCTINMIAIGY